MILLIVGKWFSNSGLFWLSGLPSGRMAIQFNIQTPLDSIGVVSSMAIYAYNVRKDERESKMLSAKKVWRLVVMLVFKPNKCVTTCLRERVGSLQHVLLQSMPNFRNAMWLEHCAIGNGNQRCWISGELSERAAFPWQIKT